MEYNETTSGGVQLAGSADVPLRRPAPTHVAFSSGATDGSLVVARPTGTQAGDLLIAFARTLYPGSFSISSQPAPTGWTILEEQVSYDTACSAVMYRWATAFDPSSWTFHPAYSGANNAVLIVAVRGCDSTTPIVAHGEDYHPSILHATPPSLSVPVHRSLAYLYGVKLNETFNIGYWQGSTSISPTSLDNGAIQHRVAYDTLNNIDEWRSWTVNCGSSQPYHTYAVVLQADPPATIDINGGGSVEAGGSSTIRQVIHEEASGGVVCSGVYFTSSVEEGLGGVAVGGQQSNSIFVSREASGGVVSGGTSSDLLVLVNFASGGVGVGGTASPSGSQTITVGGGVVVAGAAVLDVADSYQRHAINIRAGKVSADITDAIFIVALELSDVGNMSVVDSEGNPIGFRVRQFTGGVAHIELKATLLASSDNLFYILTGRA